MLEQMEQTVGEFPALVDALVCDFDADRDAMSLVGISMGAFLAYRAIAAGLPLQAVVALLGSPEWSSASSAHRFPEQFANVALLSITAEHDVSVPPPAVGRFHAALDVRYGVAPSRRHDVLAGAGHLTSRAEWERAMALTMEWLVRYGGEGAP
jgi:pimeloyl-ACP methyl ester carboxylesterase